MHHEWVGKRKAARQEVMIRAEIRFLDGRDTRECTIVDVSATGARLELPEDFQCPVDFDLFIPARSELKIAKLRRQDGRLAGVEFLKSRSDDPQAMQSLLDRLARLERGLGPATDTGENDGSERRGAATAALNKRLGAIEDEFAELRHVVDVLAVQPPRLERGQEPASDAGGRDAANKRLNAIEDEFTELRQIVDILAAQPRVEAPPDDVRGEIAWLREEIKTIAKTPSPAGETDIGGAIGGVRVEIGALKAEIGELREHLRVMGAATARNTALLGNPERDRPAPSDSSAVVEEIAELRSCVQALILLVSKTLNRMTGEA